MPKSALLNKLKRFQRARQHVEILKSSLHSDQEILLKEMEVVDPENRGLIMRPDDTRGTAFRVEPKASEGWDRDAVLAYITNNPTLWRKCTSRFLDMRKFEACVDSREIPPSDVAGLRVTLSPSSPYIRFGPAQKNSL